MNPQLIRLLSRLFGGTFKPPPTNTPLDRMPYDLNTTQRDGYQDWQVNNW